VFVASLAARRHRLLFSLRAEKFTLECLAKGGDDIYKRMKGIMAHHTTKPTYCKGYGMGLSRSSGLTVARYVLWAAMNVSSTSNLGLQRWLEWTVERRRGQVDSIRIQRLLELRTRKLHQCASASPYPSRTCVVLRNMHQEVTDARPDGLDEA
jgi:hypothetical protein